MSTKNNLTLILGVGLGACATSTHTKDLAVPANFTSDGGDNLAIVASQPSDSTPVEPERAARRSSNPQQPSTASREARVRTAMPWEFAIGGAGISNDDVSAGAAQLGASVGYYFNEVVEVSVRQSGGFSDAGQGSPDVWDGATRGALDFHFPFGRFVPYVGANLGYAYGDSIHDTWLGGPEAGVKLYLKDDAFLQAGAEYQFFFDGDNSISRTFDDGQLLYGISLGLRF